MAKVKKKLEVKFYIIYKDFVTFVYFALASTLNQTDLRKMLMFMMLKNGNPIMEHCRQSTQFDLLCLLLSSNLLTQ